MKSRPVLARLLELALPPRFRDAALGDLAEEYEAHVLPGRGPARARLWLAGQVLRSLPHALVLRALEKKRPTEGDGMFSNLIQDARLGLRMLGRNPGFTFTAVLSLGVGIGATTALFSVADVLLLRARTGIVAPETLTTLGRTEDGASLDNLSYPNYLDYRDRNAVFTALAAYRLEPDAVSLGGEGGAERVYCAFVSGNYFSVLGTRPALGRLFRAEEDEAPDAPPAVVLSHALWERRFSGDPSLSGKTILVNGQPSVVVGVAPRDFSATSLAVDLWMPLTARPRAFSMSDELLTRREGVWLQMVGRLRPGMTLQKAQAAMGVLAVELEEAYPDANRGQGIRLLPWSPLPAEAGPALRRFIALIALVAGLVLAIACINVVGMELALVAARGRELAVRQALGASRSRLARLALTENMILFLLGCALGLFLAFSTVPGITSLVSVLPIPLRVEPRFDLRAAAFGLVLSLGCAVASGLVPAVQGSSAALTGALKHDPHVPGFRRLKLRSLLVAGQVAMALSLLVAAGLFLRALQRAASIDPGFDPRGVDVALIDLKLAGYGESDGRAFWTDLLERARALPAVEAAALATDLPLDFSAFQFGGVNVPGREPPPDRDSYSADWNIVTPDYFRTMGIRLVRGRDFLPADRAGTPEVAIVNETMARTFWPEEDPIGKPFWNGPVAEGHAMEVVGVAPDGKYRSISDRPRFFVYVPLSQLYRPDMALLVRRSRDASALASVRALVRDLNPNLPLVSAQALSDYVSFGLLPQRIAGAAATSLGVVGLLLAALGVYGITAYSVARRTREIGIRMALGAERRSVVRLMIWEGLRVGAAGGLVGLVVSLALTRLLGSLLLGVSATDIPTFAAVSILLGGVLLLACYVPARKASTVDPQAAVRYE